MLEGCSRPLVFTVGTMNTSTSRDITHCAIDSSRYCRFLLRRPVDPVSGWKMRAETPMRSVRRMKSRPRRSRNARQRERSTRPARFSGVSPLRR